MSEAYTALFMAYGSLLSLAHSIVMARWSLALLDEHQLRFFLFYAKRDFPVFANTIVAACLTSRAGKAAADALRRKLTDHTMRSDTVNAVGALPGMIRTEFGVGHQRAIE